MKLIQVNIYPIDGYNSTVKTNMKPSEIYINTDRILSVSFQNTNNIPVTIVRLSKDIYYAVAMNIDDFLQKVRLG